jgi:hypothetical protein
MFFETQRRTWSPLVGGHLHHYDSIKLSVPWCSPSADSLGHWVDVLLHVLLRLRSSRASTAGGGHVVHRCEFHTSETDAHTSHACMRTPIRLFKTPLTPTGKMRNSKPKHHGKAAAPAAAAATEWPQTRLPCVPDTLPPATEPAWDPVVIQYGGCLRHESRWVGLVGWLVESRGGWGHVLYQLEMSIRSRYAVKCNQPCI